MRKKILALLLVLATFAGITPAYAKEDITVYLSVSRYGEIVKDKSGCEMANAVVELTGEDSYTLDDVFRKGHELYYEDGINGYSSSETDWGFGVDKIWGDTSYNFGYQINGGNESVMGPGHIVKDGDFVDAVIYKNAYPDTESYATFDKHIATAQIHDLFEITLSYVSGYDDNWNSIFSPCENATILINGADTEYVTDTEGKAYINFESSGSKIISAKKEMNLKGDIVPAITAPVCVVNVKENPAIFMTRNLAEKYAKMNFEDAGGNLPWIIADLMVYEEVFDTEILSEDRKKEALSIIVEDVVKSSKPGDFAKAIIAIRSLGYDAENIITKDYEKVNLVKNLTDFIDLKDDAATNIYTLPYVLIALSQGDDYATAEQIDYLISSAIENKDAWQEIEYGTDSITPMILALSPYVDIEDVKDIIDEAVEIVKSEQREDGLIDGYEGYESASTALAIVAFSALGIDSASIKNSEKNLIEGLMSTANSEYDKFPNAFADEQGLRGLLSWQLIEKSKKMYDFSNYPMETANIAGVENCPVIFNVTPINAVIAVSGHRELDKNVYDLPSGSYEYTATVSGYRTVSGTFVISESEAENNKKKVIEVSLSPVSSGGGSGGGSWASNNSNKEETKETEQEEKQEEINIDVIKTEFSHNTFPDVKENDWFFSAVKYVYEKKLFTGTDNGFEPDSAMTRAMLVTVLHRLSESKEIITKNPFEDVSADSWYTESVNWAAANNLISGISETIFAPDSDITREQLATIIYRYAQKFSHKTEKLYSINISDMSDYDNISDYALEAIKFTVNAGIMTGRENNEFCPKEKATRAEVASMLMRFISVM